MASTVKSIILTCILYISTEVSVYSQSINRDIIDTILNKHTEVLSLKSYKHPLYGKTIRVVDTTKMFMKEKHWSLSVSDSNIYDVGVSKVFPYSFNNGVFREIIIIEYCKKNSVISIKTISPKYIESADKIHPLYLGEFTFNIVANKAILSKFNIIIID